MPESYDQLITESRISRNEARLLLAHLLSKEKTWLLAHGDEEASTEIIQTAKNLFKRRHQGEPIAYLVGSKEFYGRAFAVGPGVLIPRPETEHLLEWGLELLCAKGGQVAQSALDLGCGSGCLGLTIVLQAKQLDINLEEMILSDISFEALRFAGQNASQLGLHGRSGTQVNFRQGSWFEAMVPNVRFDLILSNPPYIREGDTHLVEGDLRFEPSAALSSGQSGLLAITEIIATAVQFLKPKAWLVIEHGFDQAANVQALFRHYGYVGVETRPDLAGHPRISAASRR